MENDAHPSFGFLLIDAGRLLRRRFEQECRDLPMTGAQLQLIVRVSKNEGIGQAALAALLDIEPMTVSRHVDRMIAAGLVTRVQDPDDRRARKLFTTEKSRDLLTPMRGRAQTIFDEAQAGLDPRAREILRDNLELIIGNLARTTSEADTANERKPNASRSDTHQLAKDVA